MFLVGLTGGIATGKSLVTSFFNESGIPIIDADLIARQIVEPGKPAYKKIKKSFGVHVFKENGELDRAKLGLEIFSDVEKRKLLNSITHPDIYGEMKKQVLNYFLKGHQFVLMDLPLLFETRSVVPYLYKTIVVTCDPEVQMERLTARNSFSEKEAKKRIESQMSLDQKVTLADFVIENSGSIGSARKQVDDILKLLKASNRHIRNRLICGSVCLVILIAFIMLLTELVKFTGNYL